MDSVLYQLHQLWYIQFPGASLLQRMGNAILVGFIMFCAFSNVAFISNSCSDIPLIAVNISFPDRNVSLTLLARIHLPFLNKLRGSLGFSLLSFLDLVPILCKASGAADTCTGKERLQEKEAA